MASLRSAAWSPLRLGRVARPRLCPGLLYPSSKFIILSPALCVLEGGRGTRHGDTAAADGVRLVEVLHGALEGRVQGLACCLLMGIRVAVQPNGWLHLRPIHTSIAIGYWRGIKNTSPENDMTWHLAVGVRVIFLLGKPTETPLGGFQL